MDRHLVISADCHAGLLPEDYRAYLDPQYREVFDQVLPQLNGLRPVPGDWLLPFLHQRYDDPAAAGIEV